MEESALTFNIRILADDKEKLNIIEERIIKTMSDAFVNSADGGWAGLGTAVAHWGK